MGSAFVPRFSHRFLLRALHNRDLCTCPGFAAMSITTNAHALASKNSSNKLSNFHEDEAVCLEAETRSVTKANKKTVVRRTARSVNVSASPTITVRRTRCGLLRYGLEGFVYLQ